MEVLLSVARGRCLAEVGRIEEFVDGNEVKTKPNLHEPAVVVGLRREPIPEEAGAAVRRAQMNYHFDELLEEFAWYNEEAGIALRGDLRRSDLLCESHTRLKQLEVLVKKIEAVESEFESAAAEASARHSAAEHLIAGPNPTNTDWHRFMELTRATKQVDFEGWDEIILYVECFYYIAFRCCRVLEQLPALEKLSYKGILLARNNLIEHADGHAKIFSNSRSWSATDGVRLRAIRQEWDGKNAPDSGFRPNLGEFVGSLSKLLAALKTGGLPKCEWNSADDGWPETHRKFHNLPTAERVVLRRIAASGGQTNDQIKSWLEGLQQTGDFAPVVSELSDRFGLICLDVATGKWIVAPRLLPHIEKLLATCPP